MLWAVPPQAQRPRLGADGRRPETGPVTTSSGRTPSGVGVLSVERGSQWRLPAGAGGGMTWGAHGRLLSLVKGPIPVLSLEWHLQRVALPSVLRLGSRPPLLRAVAPRGGFWWFLVGLSSVGSAVPGGALGCGEDPEHPRWPTECWGHCVWIWEHGGRNLVRITSRGSSLLLRGEKDIEDDSKLGA